MYISQLCPLVKTFKAALLGLKFLLQMHVLLIAFCKSLTKLLHNCLSFPTLSLFHPPQTLRFFCMRYLGGLRQTQVSGMASGPSAAAEGRGLGRRHCPRVTGVDVSWLCDLGSISLFLDEGAVLGSQQTWIQVPALPHPSWMLLCKLCQLPVE